MVHLQNTSGGGHTRSSRDTAGTQLARKGICLCDWVDAAAHRTAGHSLFADVAVVGEGRLVDQAYRHKGTVGAGRLSQQSSSETAMGRWTGFMPAASVKQ